MHIDDEDMSRLRTDGYLIIEGFVGGEELRAAQEGVLADHPAPDGFFADETAQRRYARSPFAGLRVGPFSSWAVNRLTFHPDLVDLAERFLGTTDLHLYKTELWAKYSGIVDYDQTHHRDFGNHSIVVPRRADPPRQLTTFLLLSDVCDDDGPTAVVPFAAGEAVPYWPVHQDPGAFADVEVRVTGPAGTLFAYRTDILHRGTAMTGERRHRFALLADYQAWGDRWAGKVAWPDRAVRPGWTEMIERATPRERALLGFPAPGDSYWDDQTRTDVHARYPNMDMTPYR